MLFGNGFKNNWVLTAAVAAIVSACICQSASAGLVVAWGYNPESQCDVPAGNDFAAIAASAYHSLALKADGALAAWGWNPYGQCSDIPGGAHEINDVWYSDCNDFATIAAGCQHSLALKADGSLAGWGYNSSGQCDVPDGNDFVAVSAGKYHSLALKADGSLAAWGFNDFGQCNVPAGSDFVAVAAGKYQSLALKADGSLAAWGDNPEGQCDVPAGNDFAAIAAGAYHSLALKADGALAAWGWNPYGQCSDIPGGAHEINDVWYSDCNDFATIAAGCYKHSLALKADGSLAGWGYNSSGQCDVPDGNDFVAVSAGKYHSLALKADGSLAAWGFNDFGHRGRRQAQSCPQGRRLTCSLGLE